MFVKINLSGLVYCLRAAAYPSEEHMKSALLGQVLTLPANTRLGSRGLPGTNTVAYYEQQ